MSKLLLLTMQTLLYYINNIENTITTNINSAIITTCIVSAVIITIITTYIIIDMLNINIITTNVHND